MRSPRGAIPRRINRKNFTMAIYYKIGNYSTFNLALALAKSAETGLPIVECYR